MRQGLLAGLFVLVGVAGCAAQMDAPKPAVVVPTTVAELRPGILQGYLAPAAAPDSLALVPPPPVPGSAAAMDDIERSNMALDLRDTPRWTLAAADAVLHFPEATDGFACAMDLAVSETATPNLSMLLRRSLTDAGLATYAAKNHYQRQRPFMSNGIATCTPEEESMLRSDGSYPSGHSAIGWAWALILTELVPERTDAILARGRAFSESRMVCNVHWASDVAEGRMIGAAVVARLHADPVFRAQLELARGEVAAQQGAGARPTHGCDTALDAPLPVSATTDDQPVDAPGDAPGSSS